jgi:hypothetical protein
MAMENSGFAAVPGINAALLTVENLVTWGPMEYNRSFILPATVSGASLDLGSSPTTLLRPGLLMGLVTATKLYKPWSPTATDGSQNIVGPLIYDVNTLQAGVATDRWFGYILGGGLIRASGLIIDGASSTPGISGHASEWLVRNQMASRFFFDDQLGQHHGESGFNAIVTKTADYSVTAADNNTLFNNLGDTGAIVFTLPAVATSAGLRYAFADVVAHNLTVQSAAAGGMIVAGNAAANSVVLTGIGQAIEVVGIGSNKWLVLPMNGTVTATVSAITTAIADPGNAGAIPVTGSGYVPLVSAGAETRTLAAPTFIGQELLIYFKTDGGTIVLTCATTLNEAGNNTLTFAEDGQAVRITAVEQAGNLRWRCLVDPESIASTV